MKVVLSSAAAIFLMGAIFWAGATYNRVGAIEMRLAGIETQLSRIGDINVISERSNENQKRIERLESLERQRH